MKQMDRNNRIILFLCMVFAIQVNAKEIIEIKPGKEDMTTVVRNAIENAKDKDIKLVFSKATYRFLPDYAKEQFSFITNHGNGLKKIIFLLSDFDSVEVEGNGAEFIFHGQVEPFQFNNCKKISVKNITIDWDIPFSFQGDITAVNEKEHWFEMKPYTKGYSWKLNKGRIYFPNVDDFHFASLGSTLAFDKDTKQVAYGAWDMSLRPNKVERKKDGVLRIYDENMKKYPRVGSVFHSKGPHEQNRYAPAFQVTESKNVVFDHVVIHHALGMGFLFERTDGVQILNSGIYIKDGSDRAISTIADATHFANCKGNILIENSRFEGMLDDGTNVHGTYVVINKVINKNTVRVKLEHFEQTGFKFADKGDEVWFIKSPNPSRGEINTVSNAKYINDVYTDLTFTDEIPSDLKVGDVLENKTWNPVFTMRGCTIRDHRARNIIIKTPLKIIIENNDLSSMMSSIMLRGETYFWFESGNVEDVVIRNNRFVHCAYGGAPEHAILKVSPRLGKTFDQTALYDRNILFENNTIETFDNCIIWADRLDGLIVRGNTIKQTTTEKPQYPDAALFYLKNCNDVEISKNKYDGDVTNYFDVDDKTKQTLKVKRNKGFTYKK
ncbi:right-handed parallel beta-helix repeat-containing protein [Wenyingzhuangia sp. 2_MG-2023]|uniref:right-handed parallel beta-helix repeat-containing protein n=1 Tax=Wenyingzhuangia sp. 2_MG-2023 TaxID=3062639 RepID=UPI0026E48D2F|nr:right-handed parallel beta-helix repeat-containing protein [Wenyingzhuangia sp. 2_MG-2023]MDO6737041.1 right-handed parallel beta-helix repeat-containing protein [Wenyingzhuangia sp. 2_MG-2023]